MRQHAILEYHCKFKSATNMSSTMRLVASRRGLLQRPCTFYRPVTRTSIRQKSTAAAESFGGAGAGKNGSTSSPQKIDEATNPKDLDVPMSMWYHRLGPVTNFFRSFDRLQHKRPLAVQFCASIVVYFFGDLMAQSVEGSTYDSKRAMKNMLIGGTVSLPGYKW